MNNQVHVSKNTPAVKKSETFFFFFFDLLGPLGVSSLSSRKASPIEPREQLKRANKQDRFCCMAAENGRERRA